MSTIHGRRNTTQRRMVLEELRKVRSHPTAVEVYELVRRRLPKISLGTVYRNLDLLSRTGVIQKLDLGSSSEARFDGNPDRHTHVRCVRCGKVDDLGGTAADLLDSVRLEPAGPSGYRILGYRLEYLGLCPRCAAGAPESETSHPPMDKRSEVE